MFSEIFVREMMESLASRKMLSITLLCCTLIPLSVLVNYQSTANAILQQERARAEYQRSLEGQAASEEVEVKAFRQRPSLAGLAGGLDPVVPTVASISQRGMTFGHGEVVENPVARLFGTIDLLFIVRFILSLVAISLSYNLVCGEKESGTFRLILSNPVPRDSILLGKVASAFTTLLLPFLVASLATLLFLQVSGDQALSSSEGWLAIGLFFLVSVLYLAAFVHLGALVSALTNRSMTSMTILLAVWVALVAVIPQTAGLLAGVIYPVESPESFLLRKSLVVEDLETQRAQELQPYVGRDDYNDLRKPIAEKYADRLQTIHARMDETYEVERQTQRRVATTIAAASPASLLTFTATAVAGTGILHAEHFTSRLADFRQQVHDELFSSSYRDYFLTSPGTGNIGLSLRTSLIDLEDLPVFSYEPPSMNEVLRAVWPYLLLLVVLNVALFLITYLRFRRYDVR